MDRDEQHQRIILFNQGDKEAFAAVYKKLSGGIFAYTKKLLHNNQDSEDVLADAFIKAWNQRGHFESMEKLTAFLHVTARNAAIDRLRHSQMQADKEEEIRKAMFSALDIEEDEHPITQLLLSRIHFEIEKLPKALREILQLSYFGEFKNAEIAKRLGISEKTVRNQKAKAHNRIRISLIKNPLAG